MARFYSTSHQRRNRTVAQIMLLLGIIAAFVHGLGMAENLEMPYQLMAKGAGVTLLGLYAFLSWRTRSHLFLSLALFLSAAGDVLIAIPSGDPAIPFLNGLIAFLASHLVYIGVFLANREKPSLVGRLRYILCALLWLGAIATTVYLQPLIGDLFMWVIIYVVALTTMTVMALLSRYNPYIVGLGALMFFISDGLLSYAKFSEAPSWVGPTVWVLYFGGQTLIATGIMSARDKPAVIGGYRL